MKKILLTIILIVSLIGCQPIDLEVEYADEIEAVKQLANEVDVLIEKEVDDLRLLSLKDCFKSVDEETILNELESLQKNKPIHNAYFATDSDNMFIFPHVELPEGYNPSVRPWFVDATENGIFFMTYSSIDTNVTTISIRGDVGVLSADYSTIGLIDSAISDEDIWFTENNQIMWNGNEAELYPFNEWAEINETNQMIYDEVFKGQMTSIFELDKKVIIIAKTNRNWSIIKIIEK